MESFVTAGYCVKQKSAYELRISYGSSDGCSADLSRAPESTPHRSATSTRRTLRARSRRRPMPPPSAACSARRPFSSETRCSSETIVSILSLKPWSKYIETPCHHHRRRPGYGGRTDRKSTRLNSSH